MQFATVSPLTFAFLDLPARPTRKLGFDGSSQELPEQPVHHLWRILLRPLRDTRQPFDAQIADIALSAIETRETLRYILFAPNDQRWRINRRNIAGGQDSTPRHAMCSFVQSYSSTVSAIARMERDNDGAPQWA